MFEAAGRGGFLAMAVPERYGGAGADDFRLNLVIGEECQRLGVGSSGSGSRSTTTSACRTSCASPTSTNATWLPGIVTGELITALAMTEPGTGSDLAAMTTTATREGDHYVVNGSKTFITNGINSDLVIVAAKTDPRERHRGISLLVVERGMEGFAPGAETGEARPARPGHSRAVLRGCEGARGQPPRARRAEASVRSIGNLAQERLSIAVTAMAAAEAALDWTLDYVRERKAFGQPIGSFQNSRFRLAELCSEVADRRSLRRPLYQAPATRGADGGGRGHGEVVVHRAPRPGGGLLLQMHGGYGYMLEYPIARAYPTPE